MNPGSDVGRIDKSSPRALRQRFSSLITDWRMSLGDVWNPLRASAMYEEIERFATIADAHGAAELAEPALALAVFLCSFIDTGTTPVGAQRQAFERLLDAAAVAVGTVGVGRDVVSPQVFLISPQPESEATLARELGRRGFVVRPFERAERAVAASAGTTPEVLIVDEVCMAELHALIKAIELNRETHRDMPFCLLLADTLEPARILFAQRAGVDTIVPRNEPLKALNRLDELQARRHSLGFRVLVVDDDRAQAKFCESVLRHRGIQTQACERAADAIAAVESFRPDLVLLDLYLPDGNGIEVAQQIRAIPTYALLPLVFLSGEHDLDRRFDAISMGGDDFLTKPVKPRHLLMTIESRVRRARRMTTVAPSHGERRGMLAGRDTFVREAVAAMQELTEHAAALLCVRPDAIDIAREALSFVAGGELSQQVAAAVAAELAFARPICASGADGFLGLVRFDDPLALRSKLEMVRERLVQRRWAAAPQLALDFTLVAMRLDADSDPEAAIRGVLRLIKSAQHDGGARCVFEFAAARSKEATIDPQERVVRALLCGPFQPEAIELEFQPLIPLRGEMAGQYALRMALQPPGSTRSLRIEAVDCVAIAYRHRLESAADRHLLRGAIMALSRQPNHGAALRFYAPISAASLHEPAFSPWLAAELRVHGVPSHALALTVSAAELDSTTPSDAAFDAVARAGVRFCLDLNKDVAARRWLALPNVAVVNLGSQAPIALAAQARELGKIVVVSDIDDPRILGERLRLDVHYLRGEALTSWLTQPEFDFSYAVI